jgi:hypothetical protein
MAMREGVNGILMEQHCALGARGYNLIYHSGFVLNFFFFLGT